MVTESEVLQQRLMSFDASAKYCGLTGQSLRRLMLRGILRPVRIPTLRRVLFDRQDLDELIEAGKGAKEWPDASIPLVTMEVPTDTVGAEHV
jgi:hypothetical protein